MKKTLALIALSLSLGASADLITPDPIWDSDFYKIAAENDGKLGDGWITYGTGAKPNGTWLSLFPNYATGPYYELVDLGPEMVAMSCSSFSPASQADAWLVTPEFEVTDDKMLVGYQVFAQGSDQPSPFCIYVSDSGAEKENFGEEPFLVTSFKGSSQGLMKGSRYFALNGYKGKKIRIAFVNNGTDKGVLGFNKIHAIPYYSDVVNYTPQFVENGFEALIRMECTLAFPETVVGFTATLETSDGETQTYTSTKSFSTIMATQKFSFPNKLKMTEGRSISYKVTITPKKEGYAPIVYTAAISAGEPTYPSVALIEEITATTCQYCPRGAAALDYYNYTYNGQDGKNKAVCVSVHNGDVMHVYNNPYYPGIVQLPCMPNGMPGAIFNRQFAADPASEDMLLKLFEKKAYGTINITDVDWENATVKYDAAVSLDMDNPNLYVTSILLENNVRGDSKEYNQDDIYGSSDYDMESLIEEYGEGMAAYFEPYLNYPSKVIPFGRMRYNYVARGCYPSFLGQAFDDRSWKKEEAKSDEIQFEYPSSVMKRENVEIVVALVDGVNGQVISADYKRRDASNAVEGIHAGGSEIVIAREADAIVVAAGEADGSVDLYGANGMLLGEYALTDGALRIDASMLEGVVIVKAVAGDASATKKLVF